MPGALLHEAVLLAHVTVVNLAFNLILVTTILCSGAALKWVFLLRLLFEMLDSSNAPKHWDYRCVATIVITTGI